MTFNIGDTIATTVYMIGGRQDEVTGVVTELKMSRKTPERVAFYVIDASGSGHGLLSVETGKARDHTGYVCKTCGGPSPVGVGYVDNTDGAAQRSAGRSTCDCGASRSA